MAKIGLCVWNSSGELIKTAVTHVVELGETVLNTVKGCVDESITALQIPVGNGETTEPTSVPEPTPPA